MKPLGVCCTLRLLRSDLCAGRHTGKEEEEEEKRKEKKVVILFVKLRLDSGLVDCLIHYLTGKDSKC